MGNYRGRRKSVSTMDIEKMCKYMHQGKSIESIAEIMGLSPATVQRHVVNIGKRPYRRVANKTVIEELKKGIEVSEVAKNLGTSIDRVEKLYRENIRDMPKKDVTLTERQLEIKKLCEEVARQKLKMQQDFDADLREEKERLANRFKGIVV